MRKIIAFLAGLLAIAGLSLFLPRHYGVPYPKPLGPRLSTYPRQSYMRDIETSHASLVLLGDSLLDLGVNADELAGTLGRPVTNIAVHGSASSTWYLITRHNVVTADPPPDVLVIVFRDSILTAPGYRVQGKYYTDVVYENTNFDDTLFVQYSFINLMSPAEKLAEQYIPLYGQRLDVREAIDYRLRHTLPSWLLACDANCTNQAMDGVFQASNFETGTLSDAIAGAEAYLYMPANLDFDARVEQSYLPEIIRMTRERGIQLVLVRFKTWIFPNAASEPADLQAYMHALSDYLEANQVVLLNYAFDARLPEEYYIDPFHMNAAGRAAFTQILAEDLRPILESIP